MSERRQTLNVADEDAAIASAVATLRRGGIIAYPTETVYGLGADPWNNAALERLGHVKQRADGKPFLLVTPSFEAALLFIADVAPVAHALMDEFWPGPLTLVFRARPTVSPLLTQGTLSIGVRIPSHPFSLRLTNAFGGPVTSTSANITGKPTPGTVDEIEGMLGGGVDLYIDAGVLVPRKPSTVVDVSTDVPRLLRDGAVSIHDLLRIVPSLRV